MFVIVQTRESYSIHGVFGPFDSLDDPKIKKVIKKGGFENDLFPADKGIRKRWPYKNSKGQATTVYEVEPVNKAIML